jgi:hypothetical protein
VTDPDPISPAVRRLLARLRSVSEVEVLVLLARSKTQWTVAQLARELVVAESHAASLLDAIGAAGLGEFEDDAFVYRPRRRGDRSAAKELARVYDTYRVRVSMIVLAQPEPQLQDFADAFRLRQDDEDVLGDG